MSEGKGDRKGNILLMFMLVFTALMVMLAFALDIGYILATRSELQHAADSSALAAVFKIPEADADTRDLAEEYAGYNKAADVASLLIDRNDANADDGGVVIGYIYNPLDLSDPLLTENIPYPNSVQVETTRTAEFNGVLDLFVGTFTGLESVETGTRATATIDNRVFGFEDPGNQNAMFLPFAIYEGSWYASIDRMYNNQYNNVTYGQVTTLPPIDFAQIFNLDGYYSYCTASGEYEPYDPQGDLNYDYGPFDQDVYGLANIDRHPYLADNVTAADITGVGDGVPEISLYPWNDEVCTKTDHVPGNWGTVDIGTDNNSQADINRQILEGLNPEEFNTAIEKGLLDLDPGSDYTTILDGDTGVGSTDKPFTDIIGQKRIALLYRVRNGEPGENLKYTISGYVGVRIMDVQMTGALADRRVIVQPALMGINYGKFDPEMPTFGNVYVYGLTR